MEMTGKEKLLLLADVLDTKVPDGQFDLNDWTYEAFKTQVNTGMYEKDYSCGFVGCAVGYACTIPAFNDLGLKFNYGPIFEGNSGWPAVSSFFGINSSSAYHLFDTHAYSPKEWYNPHAVAERIREFVKANEPSK